MNNLPVKEAVKHLLICGTTGSGKTTAIRLFLQSIAPRFKKAEADNERLIIFDVKGDVLPILAGLGLDTAADNVWILNPFDERAAVWNLGEAVQGPAMARYLASLFVPEEKKSNAPYFSQAAQEIVFWVATALNKIAGPNWTLRDLLNALESKERITSVAAQHPRAGRILQRHLADTKHFPSVLSTLSARLNRFEEVAALWHSNPTGRRFSIPNFLKSNGVLILGHDPVLKESIWPINAIMLQALTNEILRQSNTEKPRHWFVLDEFRSMEKLDCVRDLLNVGRSKGVSVLLGIQNIEGMVEVYQEHVANEILSLCSTKTFLRAGGPFTAEWAERHFNKVRHVEKTVSQTWSSSGNSTTEQHQVQERSLFLPAMFLDLPFPEKGGIYACISDIPCLDYALLTERPFDDLLNMREATTDIPGVMLRTNTADQTVQPWSTVEETFFCGPPPPEPQQSEPKADSPKPGGGTLPTAAEQQQRRQNKDNPE